MATSAAGAGGKPSGSSSAIFAATASGYHILRIHGYAGTKGTPTGEYIKSHPFTVGGHRWTIRYYPNGYSLQSSDHISFFLELDDESVANAVRVQYHFRFVDQEEENPLTSQHVTSFVCGSFRGYTNFIKREELEKSEHLKDHSFAVRCDIAVIGLPGDKRRSGNTHRHSLCFSPVGRVVLCSLIIAKIEAFVAAAFVAGISLSIVYVTMIVRRSSVPTIGVVRVEEMVPEAHASGSVAVPASDLHQHLGDLLRDEKGADVVFDVGGRTFAAHRCVLAARSPVFRAELFGAMRESHAAAGVVHVDNMEARAFKCLLQFIYTDMFPVPETSKEAEGEGEGEEEQEDVMAQHLLVAADRYSMERLKLMCEDKLCKYIGVGTVPGILTLAERHHCHGLKKACFEFLSSAPNLRAVAAGDGFKHLASSCPSIMEELVVMLGKLVP